MVFSSLLFLFRFLPFALIFYFISPKRYKNLSLFLISLVFYGWGEPVYISLMIFSTIVDYVLGRVTYYYKNKNNIGKAKIFVAFSIIINLSLLCFFKYLPLDLPLPIGISFYTFQTMSYTIDVYRGEVKPQKNIISFGTYVTLFPQLIAGPIVQYKTISKELDNRKENIEQFSYGITRFIIGLGKKVLLANNIGLLWNNICDISPNEISVVTAWIGIIAFAFQIYFDFSGYSDMAIGLGYMFGFSFLENFNYPYLSKSITEFWRRWHISLGSWFREYVYIPLGGNRKHQIRNICIVWLLTGVWHGASLNFLLWGLYFGVILIIEKTFLLKVLDKLPLWINRCYALLLILFGWVIFVFDNISEGIDYFKLMFGIGDIAIINNQTMYILYTNLILFLILILGSTEIPKKVCNIILTKLSTNKVIIIENIFLIGIFILCIAYLVDASYNPFLYFRF